MESSNVTLNRQLGMREGITITTGTVIGVGLFTTGANCVGIMGAGIILLTFIGLLICILPALMYAEMALRCRMQAVLTTTLRELSVCRWQISLHGII